MAADFHPVHGITAEARICTSKQDLILLGFTAGEAAGERCSIFLIPIWGIQYEWFSFAALPGFRLDHHVFLAILSAVSVVQVISSGFIPACLCNYFKRIASSVQMLSEI